MDRRLYRAVTSGDVDALASLIGRRRERAVSGLTIPIQMEPYNPPLNILHQLTPGGNTVLHLAALSGHLQIVQMLLELIPDDTDAGSQFIVVQNLKRDTALHEAAEGGH
ncbi:hypothetical protein SUGI_0972850 [Cryptomeria japonica]|nr:hypothetical protein SUGI_0972850 [Cryptomeria japonica]